MFIYFIMIFLWGIGYCLLSKKKAYFIYASILLTLVMGLKKYTVGADWTQYLYVYRNVIPSLALEDIVSSGRTGFYGMACILHKFNVSDQNYIFIIGLILSVGFIYFFYQYSDNLFLTLYLHVTIGMFTMSMSGVRQSIAVVIVLLAFIYIERKKYLISVLLVLAAASFHVSAVAFFIVYLCVWNEVDFKRGVLLWAIVASSLAYRKLLVPILSFFTPAEYLSRISLLSDAYPINPMLVVIALAIPLACLLCRRFLGEKARSKNKTTFSVFYILACVNAFCTIMSLNSNLLGRIGFYFQSFSIVLISNTVCGIKVKKNRIIAYIVAFTLPMIQFLMSTPGGTLRIDNYLFFWQ